VQFVDWSSEQIDTIVFCTGYRITFPFFAEGFISAPDNRLRLFARVFDPDVSNVFFIGFVQPWGAIMPIAEAQSKLVADYLCGTYALPTRAEMLSAIKRQDEELARRYVGSKRHTIQVDKPVYLHRLQVERLAGQDRAHRNGSHASAQKVGQRSARGAGAPSRPNPQDLAPIVQGSLQVTDDLPAGITRALPPQ
jgi:dimethylaniline monooxygenase (N-oxide forming)